MSDRLAYLMQVALKHATVDWTEWGCWTRFADGSGFGAYPHDTHHYHVVSHRLGYGDDVLQYAREHEVCHSLIEEVLHDRPSQVIWALAHGDAVDPSTAAYEEMAAMTLQRWLRTGERPIIGGIDWDALRLRGLYLLD